MKKFITPLLIGCSLLTLESNASSSDSDSYSYSADRNRAMTQVPAAASSSDSDSYSYSADRNRAMTQVPDRAAPPEISAEEETRDRSRNISPRDGGGNVVDAAFEPWTPNFMAMLSSNQRAIIHKIFSKNEGFIQIDLDDIEGMDRLAKKFYMKGHEHSETFCRKIGMLFNFADLTARDKLVIVEKLEKRDEKDRDSFFELFNAMTITNRLQGARLFPVIECIIDNVPPTMHGQFLE